ncbi:hypothetical protein cce_4433 [Crocosphaera subtropica ATCC 51142]|uniref:PEP-CTERM protein-sorting domain-containing protein n=1 Tax=Crocosphaera subtropica (strain ATCC 51142 / BH68) TaxID=43989 RepID=B1WUC7_CROS5|nr:anchor protein [Crocosphaera subtropica]ACB53781.1 hypothetical protein cce_4433 [Crocosphaera subtropica ATCC 51142]
MKKLIQSLSIGTIGLTVAMVIGGQPANALTFAFSQSGWKQDGERTTAEVVGTFSGEDRNGDDMIIFHPNPNINEVFAYEMNFFAGNSTFADFTHNLDNIDLNSFFLEYALGNSSAFIASIGNHSLGNSSNYDSQGVGDMGIISQNGQSITSNESVTVKEIPEPTSCIALMLFGLGGYCKRKRIISF